MKYSDFVNRNVGPREDDIKQMLQDLNLSSLDELINQTIPQSIRLKEDISLKPAISEYEVLNRLFKLGKKNKLYRSFIGLGYYKSIIPAVVQRNILENPVWYTSYTPYQAEISQGRLEALFNFQTVISELTGMPVANASLLDEATAAAEAMRMFFDNRSANKKKINANKFFVDQGVFPQTISVLSSRAKPLGIEVYVGNWRDCDVDEKVFGVLLQYPNSDGLVEDYRDFVAKAHKHECEVVVAADIMSLALLVPPSKWGADVVVGSNQRLGLPLAYGGPHAGYFATSEKYLRKMPGRIIGLSKDRNGRPTFRMALQTREQHIKREKATSNICTAQALLATMSSFYALYHGYEGLVEIAQDIHSKAFWISAKLEELGLRQENENFFDTLKIEIDDVKTLRKIAEYYKINFRYTDGYVFLSVDEATTLKEVNKIIKIFSKYCEKDIDKLQKIEQVIALQADFVRQDKFMQQEIFKLYRSETEMMRYMKRLERKDISLAHSMISLGSCTMKLNSAVSMLSLSNPHFNDIHPFVPKKQAKGYWKLIDELKQDLLSITGMDDITLQPNSGASGEHTGLLVIRAYLHDINQGHRNVCLIPSSAHGTNPASAVMAGMEVVVVKTDENGNIDVEDLKAKAEQHKDNLAALMVTYPSTHGVFETRIMEICDIIHKYGGQVYMDGANMNAQVGYTNPATIGADVCHLNLHKTFAIPHGGGGPGVGPIAVKKHLAPYLPTHPVVAPNKSDKAIDAVAAAPFGSALILTISYAYIKMLGTEGLKKSTAAAILNANYIAAKLDKYFKVLYKGENGRVAHELILDLRSLKHEIDISEIDVAKRLMDFGFHAPTVSFPVVGTLMVEPTESESKKELDRFIEAMIEIYNEIEDVRSGKLDKTDNPLKNAPHPEYEIVSDQWNHSYSRELAAYPAPFVRENKFWINNARVDDAYGDRNVVCKIL